MSIVYRNDSIGNEHQIWAQRQANSCAVAAIWMARNQARQMSMAESEWDLAWRVYQHTVAGISWNSASSAGAPTGPMSIDPNAYVADQSSFYNMFGSMGTFANQVAQALTSDGLQVTHRSNTGRARRLNISRLGLRTPAIVLLGWYANIGTPQMQRAGGHFIVAAGLAGSRIVYLDPWGGLLYELPNNRRYRRNGAGNLGIIEEVIYLSA